MKYNEIKTKKARRELIRDNVGHKAGWAIKGLLAIFEHQTAHEQNVEGTCEYNNVGFTGADGHILTSFAKQVKKGRRLSEKQMGILFARMPKYAEQLRKISDGEQK